MSGSCLMVEEGSEDKREVRNSERGDRIDGLYNQVAGEELGVRKIEGAGCKDRR